MLKKLIFLFLLFSAVGWLSAQQHVAAYVSSDGINWTPFAGSYSFAPNGPGGQPVAIYVSSDGIHWNPWSGTTSGGGATLPYPGIVYGTSASGGTIATSTQIQTAIGSNIYAPYSATAPVTAVSVASANGVSGTSSGGATPALTLALGAITPTSTNGVSAATMAFMDATSSVQTQLNGKQASGTYVTAVSVATANGVSGTSTGGATPALTLSLGAITPTSVLATGIVDGEAPVTITTSATVTLGGTYHSGYTINNDGSTAVTYTLPTAAAGLQYCVRNIAGATGTLTLQTSAAGQYIDVAGVYSASGGYVISGGALGDAGCVVGIDATHWEFYSPGGTSWTRH